MSCICCIGMSHQDSPASISGGVYDVRQHAVEQREVEKSAQAGEKLQLFLVRVKVLRCSQKTGLC